MCTKTGFVFICRKCFLIINTDWKDEICTKAVEADGKMGGCKLPINVYKKDVNSICDPCQEKEQDRRWKERSERNK
ncbi:hypothetical protein FALBO_7690 [Fusarium albosuccineum]|uniref:Uncharacterized protein n=1 Tax=Fusarium albosuccineum TaxID=1237068 RepID=A0A8H4LCI5_9HYPO|nr:hypothetical protein FALBO_7690 [Fusarium albosuccineum]